MTPEQRYFFDVAGYLHVENVLSDEELTSAQEAADRYISMPPAEWPPGFGADLERKDVTSYQHGFAFDKALERLIVHPTTWPIMMEFTNYRPRFGSGTLGYNTHHHCFHPLHAGWTKGKQTDTRRYYIDNGEIRCTDFIFFFYLTDVFPGDGGLVVVPGSHKSEFLFPRDYYYSGTYYDGFVADYVAPGVDNITPKAGDVVVISERLIHGVLNWKPKDRDRRFLIMRYNLQYNVGGSLEPFSEEIRACLSPETLEMAAMAHYETIKEIVEERSDGVDIKNRIAPE
jgi:hypothetical protein